MQVYKKIFERRATENKDITVRYRVIKQMQNALWCYFAREKHIGYWENCIIINIGYYL